MCKANAWLKRAPFDDGAEIEIRPVYEAENFGENPTPGLWEQEEATVGGGEQEVMPLRVESAEICGLRASLRFGLV